MLQLIKVFWAICRLKAGPQDLPEGRYLLIATILAGLLRVFYYHHRLVVRK